MIVNLGAEISLWCFLSLFGIFVSIGIFGVYQMSDTNIPTKVDILISIIFALSFISLIVSSLSKPRTEDIVKDKLLETTAKDLFERNYNEKAEYIKISRTRITVIDYHGNKYILPVEKKGNQMIIDTTFIELPNKSDKIRTIINNISI